MANISDLTGTKWIINENPTLPSEGRSTYYINFTSNNKSMNRVQLRSSSIQYRDATYFQVYGEPIKNVILTINTSDGSTVQVDLHNENNSVVFYQEGFSAQDSPITLSIPANQITTVLLTAYDEKNYLRDFTIPVNQVYNIVEGSPSVSNNNYIFEETVIVFEVDGTTDVNITSTFEEFEEEGPIIY